MDSVRLIHKDSVNCKGTIAIYNKFADTPYLEPGSGPMLKLYFSIPAQAAAGAVPVRLEGYPEYMPEFRGLFVPSYEPMTIEGVIDIFSCGDTDASGGVNILDVTFLIKYLYKSGNSPQPMESADTNGDGSINILDLTYMIGFLYKNGPALVC
ncbi:MAG: dockerin type I repeat-containing protein [Candidatus Zixiibacteriota bacterium]